MGFRYKTQCLDSLELLHDVIAADCPTISTDGAYALACIPSSTYISITRTPLISITRTPLDGSTSDTLQVTPVQIYCDKTGSINDITEIAWLVVLVWVTAWGFKKMADTIRGRS